MNRVQKLIAWLIALRPSMGESVKMNSYSYILCECTTSTFMQDEVSLTLQQDQFKLDVFELLMKMCLSNQQRLILYHEKAVHTHYLCSKITLFLLFYTKHVYFLYFTFLNVSLCSRQWKTGTCQTQIEVYVNQ